MKPRPVPSSSSVAGSGTTSSWVTVPQSLVHRVAPTGPVRPFGPMMSATKYTDGEPPSESSKKLAAVSPVPDTVNCSGGGTGFEPPFPHKSQFNAYSKLPNPSN